MAAAMGASRRRAHHTLSSIYKQQLARSLSSITFRRSSGFRRSDFDGQPFTGSYEIGQPTRGPLGETSNHGAPRLNPRKLKAYLDKFLIGQEIPKKLMSNAIYHHYQRIQEILRQEEEEKERVAKLARSINRFREDRFETHPVECERGPWRSWRHKLIISSGISWPDPNR
jgi:ATP-dependent Clp protease ATP-binding subunit ClpX